MRKMFAAATLAFVLAGFSSSAFAGEGYFIHEQMRKDAEKRIVEHEKEKKSTVHNDTKKTLEEEDCTKQARDSKDNFESMRLILQSKGGR